MNSLETELPSIHFFVSPIYTKFLKTWNLGSYAYQVTSSLLHFPKTLGTCADWVGNLLLNKFWIAELCFLLNHSLALFEITKTVFESEKFRLISLGLPIW